MIIERIFVLQTKHMTKATYYGAYLSNPVFNTPGYTDGSRAWCVMYRVGGYMYDRFFNDCPFCIKRQIAVKQAAERMALKTNNSL